MKKLICAIMAAAAGAAAAEVSFSYQGALKMADGAPIPEDERNKTIEFRLYEGPTDTGALWGCQTIVHLDENGLFNVELSDTTGTLLTDAKTNKLDWVLASYLGDSKSLYIGLYVSGSTGEIRPRQKLLNVPAAAFAADVAHAKNAFTVDGIATFNGAVNAETNMTVSGQLTAKGGLTVEGGGLSVTGGGLKVEGGALTAKDGLNVSGGGLTVSGGDLTISGMLTASSFNMIPQGVIVMWNGAADKVPKGWALCDGKNGTPDLRDRFIVGAGSSYVVGASGGENSVALKSSEMPSHAHIYVQDGEVYYERGLIFDHNVSEKDNRFMGVYENRGGYKLKRNNGSIDWPVRIGGATIFLRARSGESVKYDDEDDYADYPWCNSNMHLFKTGTAGGGSTDQEAKSEGTVAAHENRPPYYALCFIMKL